MQEMQCKFPTSPNTLHRISEVKCRHGIVELFSLSVSLLFAPPSQAPDSTSAPTQRGDIAVRAADAALLVAYVALEERLPRPLRDYELMLDELNEALDGRVRRLTSGRKRQA